MRPGLRLAAAICLAAAAAVGVAVPRELHASVSTAVVFDDLVKSSTTAGVATPVEQFAVWEDGKIITYTRIREEQGIAGEIGTGGETWVASRGGIIGNVGQTVDGEPILKMGKPSLLFLRPDRVGPLGSTAAKSAAPVRNASLHVVTARAQGQFDVQKDAATGTRRFASMQQVGFLYPPVLRTRSATAPPGGGASVPQTSTTLRLASEMIHGRSVEDVSRDVAASWRRLHAGQ